nr:MAG TPA: hypothetical protein [Caudoviricetes sp.]
MPESFTTSRTFPSTLSREPSSNSLPSKSSGSLITITSSAIILSF